MFVLKAGLGSHRNRYSLLLRGRILRQGLGRGIDRWGNSPVLLSPYDGFVLCSAWRANPSGLFGGLYTDAPRGGSSQGVSSFCVDELLA